MCVCVCCRLEHWRVKSSHWDVRPASVGCICACLMTATLEEHLSDVTPAAETLGVNHRGRHFALPQSRLALIKSSATQTPLKYGSITVG